MKLALLGMPCGLKFRSTWTPWALSSKAPGHLEPVFLFSRAVVRKLNVVSFRQKLNKTCHVMYFSEMCWWLVDLKYGKIDCF